MYMKHLFTALLITIYVGTAVFGVFGMHTQTDMNTQEHAGMAIVSSNCIASTAKGVDCPNQAESFDFTSFHIDGFRGFSLATFDENVLVSFLTLVLLVIGIGLGALLGNYFAPLRFSLVYSRYGPWQFSSPPKQQFLRWLALHENSPTIF